MSFPKAIWGIPIEWTDNPLTPEPLPIVLGYPGRRLIPVSLLTSGHHEHDVPRPGRERDPDDQAP